MTDFFRDQQTRQAEAVLRRLRIIVPDAVVLGGWAVYLYARGQRSIDVDIAVSFEGLSRLQGEFGTDVRRNPNLPKYELVTDGVEVDIFVEHLSNAGVPIQELVQPSHRRMGFRVINPEGLLVLKLCAWLDRRNRPKGDKDEADILSLLSAVEIDWDRYGAMIGKAHGRHRELLPGAIARLVSSAEVRGTWKYIRVRDRPAARTPAHWKRFKERLAATVPRGL